MSWDVTGNWIVLLVPTGLFGCLVGTANPYSGTAYRIPFGVVAHHHDNLSGHGVIGSMLGFHPLGAGSNPAVRSIYI